MHILAKTDYTVYRPERPSALEMAYKSFAFAKNGNLFAIKKIHLQGGGTESNTNEVHILAGKLFGSDHDDIPYSEQNFE